MIPGMTTADREPAAAFHASPAPIPAHSDRCRPGGGAAVVVLLAVGLVLAVNLITGCAAPPSF
jgi:hypothetical protein